MKVVAAFQRYIKNGTKAEIEGYLLVELRRADLQAGARDTDAGYRLALKDRISELENLAKSRAKESTKAKYALGSLSLESLRL